jgi:type IV pilus assembly protein PilM
MRFLERHLSPGLAVGLDIGSSAIKLVELRMVDGKLHLQRVGVEPLPLGAIVDGEIMDSSLVVDAIHRLSDQARLKNTACATSLSGHSVIVKRIKVPTMSDEELLESIQWEAEQYIPFDINDVRLDYLVLSEGEPGPDKMDVLLTAVKRDKVNDYVSVISQTGKTAAIVDVDVLAVQNAYEANYDCDPTKVVALVNMGAAVTNITILARGTSVFYRDLSLGGNLITEALQREFNLSFSQAEGFKHGDSLDRYSAADARGVQDTVSAEMATEIRRVFDFFSTATSEGPVEELMLSGGCALTPNLQQILGEVLEVPTKVMNPFRKVRYKPSDFDDEWLHSIAPMMAIAVGLATRSVPGTASDSLRRRPATYLQVLRRFVRGSREVPKEDAVPSSARVPRAVDRGTERLIQVDRPVVESPTHGSPPSPAPGLPSVQSPQDQPLRSWWQSPEKQATNKAIPAITTNPVSRPITKPTPTRTRGKVFLSYAREDYESARKVYAELRAAGLDVWLDRENLLPGQVWKPAIENAILASDCFIVLLSSSSATRRGFLHKEIRRALTICEELPESAAFVIPVRLDDCDPAHSALREINWVDLFPDWDDGMQRILRALEGLRSP